MTALPAYPRSWTVDEYLEMERDNVVRHEFVAGHVYALAGGTVTHSALAARLIAFLTPAVDGHRCLVHTSDMKVRVATDLFLYPDVSVSCDPADRTGRAVVLTAARLVVEVLSDSTAAYDRGDKFALYQQHAALQDYVLVDTRWQAVEVRSRTAGGDWTSRVYTAGEEVVLPSLEATIPVAAVYQGLDVPIAEPAG